MGAGALVALVVLRSRPMGRKDRKLNGSKKLVLKKETLRALDDRQLDAIAGGAVRKSAPAPSDTCGCAPSP